MTEKWREDEEYMSYVQDLLETEAVKKISELHTACSFHSFGAFHQCFLL